MSWTGRELGSGASCKVLEGRHKEDKKWHAVKQISKSGDHLEQFLQETELLRKFSQNAKCISINRVEHRNRELSPTL